MSRISMISNKIVVHEPNEPNKINNFGFEKAKKDTILHQAKQITKYDQNQNVNLYDMRENEIVYLNNSIQDEQVNIVNKKSIETRLKQALRSFAYLGQNLDQLFVCTDLMQRQIGNLSDPHQSILTYRLNAQANDKIYKHKSVLNSQNIMESLTENKTINKNNIYLTFKQNYDFFNKDINKNRRRNSHDYNQPNIPIIKTFHKSNQEFYYQKITDQDKSIQNSINHITNIFNANIYTIGLEQNPEFDFISFLSDREQAFQRDTPLKINSKERAIYQTQMNSKQFQNGRWRISKDSIEGRIDINLNESFTGYINCSLKILYQKDFQDFEVYMVPCKEFDEESPHFYYEIQFRQDNLSKNFIEFLEMTSLLYLNTSLIDYDSIKIRQFKKSSTIEIQYYEQIMTFKDLAFYNKSENSMFEYKDHNNQLQITIYENPNDNKQNIDINVLKCTLKLKKDNIPITQRNQIFKPNFDQIPFLLLRSSFTADIKTQNNKSSAHDETKYKSNQRKMYTNSKFKLAMTKGMQAEKVKNEKKILITTGQKNTNLINQNSTHIDEQQSEAVETFKNGNEFQSEKNVIRRLGRMTKSMKQIKNKIIRVLDCFKLVKALGLLEIENSKMFMNNIQNNVEQRQRWKTLYGLYQESLLLIKILTDRILLDNFKRSWNEINPFLCGIHLFNFKKDTNTEISYVFQQMAKNEFSSNNKLLFFYRFMQKQLFTNQFESRFEPWMSNNKHKNNSIPSNKIERRNSLQEVRLKINSLKYKNSIVLKQRKTLIRNDLTNAKPQQNIWMKANENLKSKAYFESDNSSEEEKVIIENESIQSKILSPRDSLIKKDVERKRFLTLSPDSIDQKLNVLNKFNYNRKDSKPNQFNSVIEPGYERKDNFLKVISCSMRGSMPADYIQSNQKSINYFNNSNHINTKQESRLKSPTIVKSRGVTIYENKSNLKFFSNKDKNKLIINSIDNQDHKDHNNNNNINIKLKISKSQEDVRLPSLNTVMNNNKYVIENNEQNLNKISSEQLNKQENILIDRKRPKDKLKKIY